MPNPTRTVSTPRRPGPRVKSNTPSPQKKYSPSSIELYNLICDGQPHLEAELRPRVVAAALATDYWACVRHGERLNRSQTEDGEQGRPLRELALSGARYAANNALHVAKRDGRATRAGRGKTKTITANPDFAAAWSVEKSERERPQTREPVSTQRFGKVTYYGGIPEWEGWAHAPLRKRDVAHVRLVHAVPLDQLRAAFPGWVVNESPDGLVSVSAHPGAPVKQVVNEWLAANNLAHEGVRDAFGVRRRDLSELPEGFLHGLVTRTVPLAQGIVSRRHGAAMEVLTGSTEDAQAWVRLWIVELVATFDAQLGRPFGTWVAGKLKYKVQDLNRQINGRTASDLEIKFAKAQEKLEKDGNQTPDKAALAQELKLAPSEMEAKRNTLAQLRAIRLAFTLDVAPDAPEIPIVDPHANPEKDAIAREQASRITMALLTSSGYYDHRNAVAELELPLGFLITYLLQWDEWVKADLTYLAGCPTSRVNREVETVRQRLRVELEDMVADRAAH